MHVTLARERLPLEVALTVASPDDGRPVFFVPHPEGVLVGTTDVFHDGALDDPRPTRAEVDYLLRIVVPDIEAYDALYQRLIAKLEFSNLSSSIAMEEMKYTTAVPTLYMA